MNEDYWKNETMKMWNSHSYYRDLKWTPSHWDLLRKTIPRVKWRHFAVGVERDLIQTIEDEEAGEVPEGAVHLLNNRLKLTEDGCFSYSSRPGRNSDIDRKKDSFWTTKYLGNNQIDLLVEFDNGIVFTSPRCGSGQDCQGTMIWPSGHSYTGWFELEQLTAKDYYGSLPAEIKAWTKQKKCTRFLTKDKILPQVMKRGVCRGCLDHTPWPAPPAENKQYWVKDGVCPCQCELKEEEKEEIKKPEGGKDNEQPHNGQDKEGQDDEPQRKKQKFL
eukprot:TRINITY_DN5464_c0_g1_i2.p1 TRINITY_DN5464_c0_g1~~TRINITY_DN5464_c0_g1_i2.p1  ORF type:complete len:305 (-),score=53.49 TRINITY_DN5464_c0_g1_i2:18-839(-)